MQDRKKCFRCSVPAREATGWALIQLDELELFCGSCAGEFARWYREHMHDENAIKAAKDWARALDERD